jgi:uncharacterized membrane protein
MIQAFEFLFANLGLTLPAIYLLLALVTSLIFSASDYRIGLITFQIFSFLGVVIFSFGDYNTDILLFAGLLSIALMVFTMYAEKNQRASGVV